MDLKISALLKTVGSFIIKCSTRSADGHQQGTESKRSPRLLLWWVAAWTRGETVLVPQVLGQAVEESSYVTQTVSDLHTWAHHRQARRLLEASHFPLGHVTVHIEVKSRNDIKERQQLDLWSWRRSTSHPRGLSFCRNWRPLLDEIWNVFKINESSFPNLTSGTLPPGWMKTSRQLPVFITAIKTCNWDVIVII